MAICASSSEGSTRTEQRDAWIADGVLQGLISRWVEADTKPGQTAADRGPHLGVIFSDAAGEDEQINPIERGDHRGHLLAHGIAEHLNGKSCIGI